MPRCLAWTNFTSLHSPKPQLQVAQTAHFFGGWGLHRHDRVGKGSSCLLCYRPLLQALMKKSRCRWLVNGCSCSHPHCSFLNPVRRACHHVQDQMSTPSPMRTWPLNLRLFGCKCAGHGKFDSLQAKWCGDPQVRTGMPRHLLLLSSLCGVTCAGSCEVDMVHRHGSNVLVISCFPRHSLLLNGWCGGVCVGACACACASARTRTPAHISTPTTQWH